MLNCEENVHFSCSKMCYLGFLQHWWWPFNHASQGVNMKSLGCGYKVKELLSKTAPQATGH